MTLLIPEPLLLALPPASPGAGGPSEPSAGTTSAPIPQPPALRRIDDRLLWREYYRVSLLGVISAQTQVPNPTLVAQLAATFADAALQEEQKRWSQS